MQTLSIIKIALICVLLFSIYGIINTIIKSNIRANNEELSRKINIERYNRKHKS